MNVVTASAPGKVIVAGEYAVLDGAPAVCMAVNKRARVRISRTDDKQHAVTAPGFRSEPQYFSTIEEVSSELPLLAAVWQQSPPMVDHHLSIELDSQAFTAASSRKLGIGSSAAIAVALAAALNQIAGGDADVVALAMQAHRQFQGGSGSGVDIACSARGGVVEYRMGGDPATSRSWPMGLHYALLWSGQSADTVAQIAKLDCGPKGATIQFHNDKYPNPAGLVDFIKDQRGLAKVKDNKIVIRRDWKRTKDRVQGAFGVARDLAAKARNA